ncbi:hypothetical protein C5167_033511 [Papaver somniferum]|uniref:Uncharacterized protein n=1 Tax=Papaver somniferum TaxID=3469 RepID=A0A4Y7KEA1_PAPSO|nr:hypothetical protein C5167_033511 [Papaver somniferum]
MADNQIEKRVDLLLKGFDSSGVDMKNKNKRGSLWQSVQVAAEHCCYGKCGMGMSWADEQLKCLWGDAGYVCKTEGGSCFIITGNPRKIARMNMEFRMDGLCKNGYDA